MGEPAASADHFRFHQTDMGGWTAKRREAELEKQPGQFGDPGRPALSAVLLLGAKGRWSSIIGHSSSVIRSSVSVTRVLSGAKQT